MNSLEETKYLLKKYNIRADKRLGQNFLIDDKVINEIITGANIDKEDFIIGPIPDSNNVINPKKWVIEVTNPLTLEP